MDAHTDKLQGRWPELRCRLRERRVIVTAHDIATLGGKQAELTIALRRRDGYAEGQAVMEINRWIADYDRETGHTRK